MTRNDLRPGTMQITLGLPKLADVLGVAPDRIRDEAQRIDVPFRLRRRGVETRIMIGAAPPEIDRTLIRNIVRARTWYADICDGWSYAEIAARDRISNLVGLAFLSPELLRQVVAGTQPAGLTTDSLIKNGFPAS